MPVATLFSRFLSALGVPHTNAWSDGKFGSMTFKSLYGLSHLLTEYGVKNNGLRIADKAETVKLTPPFLARISGGIFVIVREINPKAGTITYDSRGETLISKLSRKPGTASPRWPFPIQNRPSRTTPPIA